MFNFFKSKKPKKSKKTSDGRSIARVKAGKKAWAKKTRAQKKATLAALKKGRKKNK